MRLLGFRVVAKVASEWTVDWLIEACSVLADGTCLARRSWGIPVSSCSGSAPRSAKSVNGRSSQPQFNPRLTFDASSDVLRSSRCPENSSCRAPQSARYCSELCGRDKHDKPPRLFS